MSNASQRIIPLEEGWNDEIKAKVSLSWELDVRSVVNEKSFKHSFLASLPNEWDDLFVSKNLLLISWKLCNVDRRLISWKPC